MKIKGLNYIPFSYKSIPHFSFFFSPLLSSHTFSPSLVLMTQSSSSNIRITWNELKYILRFQSYNKYPLPPMSLFTYLHGYKNWVQQSKVKKALSSGSKNPINFKPLGYQFSPLQTLSSVKSNTCLLRDCCENLKYGKDFSTGKKCTNEKVVVLPTSLLFIFGPFLKCPVLRSNLNMHV